MDYNLLFGFLLISLPTFFTPGPNNLMLMTSAAKFGLNRTLPHAIGIIIGFPILVFFIGLGLAEIFNIFPILKIILKYFAAIYFLWLAYNLLGLKIGKTEGAARPMKFYEAALFQWINPKAWAMGVSFVSAFVVVGEGSFFSLLVLTFGCFIISPLSTFAWMVFGKQLYYFLQKSGLEKYLGIILAGLMLVAIIIFLFD